MYVAIDATPLTLTSGGIARYSSELSCALAREFPDSRFVLVSDQDFQLPPAAPANLSVGGRPRSGIERRWWLWGLNRELDRLGADVFHGTNFEVPYRPRRPGVVMLHDLSPWMEPGWHHAAERVRRRVPLLLASGAATMVVTPSEAVRREAIDRFRLSQARVAAIPLAASIDPPARRLETGAPYFLYLGVLEPRKNIPALLDAWREVRRHCRVDLVLAGRRRADFPPLSAEDGLRCLGEVPDEQLPALYAGSLAFVYPSLYEGFGLPVLEAMRCGCMVITSRAAALLELADGAALQVDPGRPLTEAMMAAATHPETVRTWQERAWRRASGFSWARTARLTFEVFEEARRRFDG